MICSSCNAEIADSARFCPRCGQSISQAAASATTGGVSAGAAFAGSSVRDSSMRGNQSARHMAQSAPISEMQAQRLPSGPNAVGTAAPVARSSGAARKNRRTPIVAAAIVAALIVATGVCYALGIGPFAAIRFGTLDPRKDPIEQLDAAVNGITDSGNYEGEYTVDIVMDLGELSEEAGMDTLDAHVSGSYSMLNYDPNDLSKLEMHMSTTTEMMGDMSSAEVDLSNGTATVTNNGNTRTQSFSTSEIERLFSQAGGMTYDSSALEEYIESSRIERDTIIITLDSDFIGELMENSLGSSGTDSDDISIDTLELRAQVGDGSITETMDMSFDMTYRGYTVGVQLAMDAMIRET